MNSRPQVVLVVCEGRTEAIYFSIIRKRFRLPTYIKVLPSLEKGGYVSLGQHEKLINTARQFKDNYRKELDIGEDELEAWAVCDRDNYKDSFTKLQAYAGERNIGLAFSDPQFENYLLQHFSANKSSLSGNMLERELSRKILEAKPDYGMYRKNDLSWLDNMIDEKHAIVFNAIKNASVFNNHTRKPFFTVQKLVSRLLALEE